MTNEIKKDIIEVVKEFFVKFPLQHTTSVLTDEDFFLGYLWIKGYRVVPIEQLELFNE